MTNQLMVEKKKNEELLSQLSASQREQYLQREASQRKKVEHDAALSRDTAAAIASGSSEELTIPHNGGLYVGPVVNGKANGPGVCTWSTEERKGDRYKGAFRENVMTGSGTYTYANGEVYEGNWSHDKAHGYGKYTWANGVVYEGDWRDDKRHGSAKVTWANGIIEHCTQWDNNCRNFGNTRSELLRY